MQRIPIGAAAWLLAALLFPSTAEASYCEDPKRPGHEIECDQIAENSVKKGGFAGLPPEVRWSIVGGAPLGLAGVAFSLRSLWWPPLRYAVAPFFARLTRRDVTEHPLRSRILEIVAQRPGISAAELGAEAKINPGTLDYHLDILERDGQLRATKAGRNRLLFLPGSGVDVPGVAELSARGRSDVARLVLQEPGLHAAAIADRLGLSRATVHHHIARLEAGGLVRVERGARARCFPTERLPPALEPPRRRRIAVLSNPSRPPPETATG